MNKNQKKAARIAVICVLLLTITAFAFILMQDMTGFSNRDKDMIIGTWTEDDTGLDVSFSKNGVFQVMGSDAATYEIDDEAKVITFSYAKSYGGQVVAEPYVLSKETLELTNKETKEVQHYTKNR